MEGVTVVTDGILVVDVEIPCKLGKTDRNTKMELIKLEIIAPDRFLLSFSAGGF